MRACLNCRNFLRRLILPAALALLPGIGHAAPGDILFSDNFNDGTLAPWTTSNASRSGITSVPALVASGSALYTRHDTVTVTSPGFNASVPAARLSFWLRRGSDAFLPDSEDTDAGEDLYVEYRRADSSWGLLNAYLGSGTKGEIYTDQFTLPADALHGNLALRVRQIAGSGVDYDYWHVDDVLVQEIAQPGPLAVGSCDNFEFGLTNWTVNQVSGLAGISSATASSPVNSLFLNGGVVSVTSNIINASDPLFTDITMWVRRGSNAFSERPDNNEDLVVEYLNNAAAWIALETFSGNGAPGQVFPRSYVLPPAGRHAGLRLRYRMTGGSGPAFDFWHVDDVCFNRTPVPRLLISKIAQTLTDPINGGSNPRAIPGAVVRYTVGVSNQGVGSPALNSIVITDPLPADTALYVATGGGDPIEFVDGAVPSGLSYSYASNVTFSNQAGGGAPYTYVPVPDAQGYDPAVTGYRINPTGIMNPAIGGNIPSFNIRFRVRIE